MLRHRHGANAAWMRHCRSNGIFKIEFGGFKGEKCDVLWSTGVRREKNSFTWERFYFVTTTSILNSFLEEIFLRHLSHMQEASPAGYAGAVFFLN